MDAHGRPTLDAERLLAVLDGVPVLLCVQDPDGRIAYVNRTAAERVRRTPEELVGRLPADIFEPATVARWTAQNDEVLRTRRSLDVEDSWGGRTYLTHKTPVFDDDGRPAAVIGISTDITEQKRAEARLTEAQQIAGVGSWHWDPDAHELAWSPELRRMLGFLPGAEPVGDETLELVHPDERGLVAEAARSALRSGVLMELEIRMRHADGEYRLMLCRGAATMRPDGTARRLDGICEDVTEQRLAERRRAAAHGVLSVMAAGRDLSDALPALLQTVVEELGWERGALWRFDGGEPALEAAWPRGTAGPQPSGRLKIPVVSGGEEVGLLEFECEPREHAGAELESFAATLGAQVGEFLVRRRAEEKRLYEALHDPLTGLPNRVLFFDRLDHAMRRQLREHAPLAVLFLDFDGFKAVNDRFGHAGGDRILRLAAAAVASSLRGEDTVARFGGDELVVLSEHIVGADDAIVIAERILDTLRAPLSVDGEEIVLTASIGICLAPVEGRSREELLASADRAMYLAKAAGPGRYVLAGDETA